MGMSGMTTDAYVKYASAIDDKKTASSMTVADLRNFVNPMTKYYDNLPAKLFMEDSSISDSTKVAVMFGNAVGSSIDDLLEKMRKAVA